MYKLAKFRKGLKENVSKEQHVMLTDLIRDFKLCFYVKACSGSDGYVGGSVRVRWDRYCNMKELLSINQSSYFWLLTKENMKHGQ
ncbi:hypothetical protein NVP1243O_72 [Vibrio phage 1.243.O._10N.261.54.B5]|nr:hypothetical protein NVP1243O_72 [Vibrio phage 1.243.O._10N.261.54.B5]